MSREIYQRVTDQIVAQLEQGAAPWVRPWKALADRSRNIGPRGRAQPHNVISNRDYNGVNVLILSIAQSAKGYTHAAWATFNQIKKAGGFVRKGEKAVEIVYFDRVLVKDKNAPEGTDSRVAIPLLKSFYVFNVEQAEWNGKDPLTRPVQTTDVEGDDTREIPTAAATIKNTGATIKHGGDSAYYIPSADMIQMPAKKAFPDIDQYYGTMFHELTHWTGHDSRCARNLSKGRFGDPEYAFEELVAELGAAFLCAKHEINGELRHAGYIGHWLKALKDEPTAIFKASALAQKAADFVLGVSRVQEQQEAA